MPLTAITGSGRTRAAAAFLAKLSTMGADTQGEPVVVVDSLANLRKDAAPDEHRPAVNRHERRAAAAQQRRRK